jgi:transglutaminase-like putative cysteine protease
MMPFAWNWLRRNLNLVLLLGAMVCLAQALGEVIRGAEWSLLMPVSLAAAVCGWGLGASRLNRKQAWTGLSVIGVFGVFMYVGGLFSPLWNLYRAFLLLLPQIAGWISERTPVDFGPLVLVWTGLSAHAASVLGRAWEWVAALAAGKSLLDPLAAGLVWGLLLWFVCAWAGWQVRRNRQVLLALVPGGVLLALALDYTRGEVSLLVVYLAILLMLMGLVRNESRHLEWMQRKIDYAESIAFDTLASVGIVTILLVLAAAGTPSLSWRELVDSLRAKEGTGEGQVAQSLGLEAPPNAANEDIFQSNGLPRQHLLSLPPEQLEQVVMTVSTGELPPFQGATVDLQPARYYWRSITYDVYTGAGWRSSPAQETPLPANTPLLGLPPDYHLLNEHIKLAPDQSRTLYWAGLLGQVATDVDIAWRNMPPPEPDPMHDGDMLGVLTDSGEYRLVSYVPQIDAARLRAASTDYPAEISSRYLRLPDTVPDRVLALAREVTQAARTPYDRAVAIEAYLRTYPYTLEVGPPPVGRDVVDYFLFTAKKGYCDYYATAMVVLARAVGLPARIVVGYASGDYDAQTAEYIVRQRNAHSWAEVYFTGVGWVEFEPTAGQPALVRPGDENAPAPSPNLSASQPALSWLKGRWRVLVTTLAGQFLLAGLGVILLFALWQVGEMGFLLLMPAQLVISRMYARLEKSAARLLPDLPQGHTPHQLQNALTRKLADTGPSGLKSLLVPVDREVEHVVTLHVAQIFSQHPPAKTQVSKGIRAWMRLRWRLWIANRWLR